MLRKISKSTCGKVSFECGQMHNRVSILWTHASEDDPFSAHCLFSLVRGVIIALQCQREALQRAQ
jgi:hypothetical protein